MRQVARKGLLTVVATGGVLAATGGFAYADAGATGQAEGSPGVASGNSVQVPVNVPVNVCGNTIDVVGLLNPAFGNHCANTSSGSGSSGHGSGHDTGSGSGATAGGHTVGSPGVGSGNSVQTPVDVPVNACGNTIDVVALLNPAFGDTCGNHEGTPDTPVTPAPPSSDTPHAPHTPTQASYPSTGVHNAPRTEELAHTGANGIGLAASAAGVLLLAGSVLYRRSTAAARR